MDFKKLSLPVLYTQTLVNFDSVNYKLLLENLYYMGLTNITLRSYLIGRQQCVQYKGIAVSAFFVFFILLLGF